MKMNNNSKDEIEGQPEIKDADSKEVEENSAELKTEEAELFEYLADFDNIEISSDPLSDEDLY